ncbi:MAG TPA: nitronate monooxygenase family protein [Gaiellaceae bacterium]|jgi:nitronate monooxygenase
MTWPSTRLADLLGVRLPILQAPMAGGPTTVELVAAVSEAGALGSLGGAGLSPDALREMIRGVRARTSAPFAVNLFAPLPPPAPGPGVVEGMQELLEPHRRRHGLEPPAPPTAPPWTAEDQLGVVAEECVPAFSFTFGIPPLDTVRDSGATVIGTATSAAEAVELERAGVDVVVAQGAEAGGHRGTFVGSFDECMTGTLALVPQVVDAVSVPVVAAGGIMDGRGIAAALMLGAAGAQIGTAFLFCPEAGVPEAHLRAIRELGTFVTASGSGRPARGARTPLLVEIEASGVEIPPYPLQRALLDDLRAASEDNGFFLGGQGAPLGRKLPAAELVATLSRETEAALRG